MAEQAFRNKKRQDAINEDKPLRWAKKYPDVNWGFIIHKFASKEHIAWDQFIQLPLIVIYMYWDQMVYEEELNAYYAEVNPLMALKR